MVNETRDRWAEAGYGRNRKLAFLATRHWFERRYDISAFPPFLSASASALLVNGRLQGLVAECMRQGWPT